RHRSRGLRRRHRASCIFLGSEFAGPHRGKAGQRRPLHARAHPPLHVESLRSQDCPCRFALRRNAYSTRPERAYSIIHRLSTQPMARTIRIGVISDTHGLLRPEALEALCDADQIVHAGDVGSPDVLDALRALAPLTVVRGNNDVGAWAHSLPETA